MINFADFHFIRPYWLLSLIPALVLWVLMFRNKLTQGNWSNVCDAELLPFILQQKATQRTHWQLTAGIFSSLLIILAMAGPTWERLPAPVFRNDVALVIALDLSSSMNATDIKPSRLIKARYKIADLLKQRKDGQTALLVYAGDAFIVSPLTDDTATITSQLSALTTEIMPSQGSNTVLALEKATALLKQAGLQSGEILLITDGIDIESIKDSIELLATGYRISILGVGTKEGAPIKLAGGDFLKDKLGNIVIPKLKSHELSEIANNGKGYYTVISNDDRDIEMLKKEFETFVKKQGDENSNILLEQWNEKGPWLLLLVLPFAAMHFRKGLLSLSILVLIPYSGPSKALEWNNLWKNQDQQAQQSFQQQNYQQAAEQFSSAEWKAASQYKAGQFQQASETLKNDQSATGLYNKGNALAQTGDLQAAIEAYQHSLQKNPDNEDAKYNLELVKKALEQQQKQRQQQEGDKDQQSDPQESSENDQKNDKQNKESEQNKEKDDTQQDSKSDQSEQQQSQQAKQEQQEDETEAQQVPKAAEYDESEQANEQWLNRIPDDPSGLLKRKFKYQYGQRKNNSTNRQSW